MNPRYRSLFAREHIAYVFSGGYMVPELGLKVFGRIGEREPTLRTVHEELSPFSLKLLGAYLTGALPDQELKVDRLTEELKKLGQDISTSKVSRNLRELLALNYAEECGRGPKKSFVLNSKDEVWYHLQIARTKTLYRATALPFLPIEQTRVWAGDSALSKLSMLSEANPRTFAIYARNEDIFMGGNKPLPKDWGHEIIVQTWKEDPVLFSVKGCLNPIELYIALRTHPDECAQIALQEVLIRYGLKMRTE